MARFYQLTKEEVFTELNSSPNGLSSDKIQALQEKFGLNVLEETRSRSRFTILVSQFKDLMIVILVVAAIISFSVGEHTDAIVILAIILANAWMGYSQEYDAEQSVKMLQKMSAQHALVLRDNNHLKIESSQLVPGDIIFLEAGDIVAADARLIEINSFKTDEASLTGESHSMEKKTDPVEGENLVPGDQLNMVFKGTIVNNGTAKAIVTTTGMNTELGKIAGMLEATSQKTPLQKRLDVFSRQLAVIVIVICMVVLGFGLLRGEPPFQMFLTSLSLAVAALPEALPAVITIALARGARRLVKQKALMRKLPAVETLGSVTYICTDKTGTLTQNVMTVEKIEAIAGKEELLDHAMMLNNEVRFSKDQVLGDPTEKALVNYVLQKGMKIDESEKLFPLLKKIPFDSQRMRMSTLHSHGDGWILFSKGAPVRMMDVLAPDTKTESQQWLNKNREWAADGLRVLFFTYKIFEEQPRVINEEIENNMHFLGMAAMIDPPREEVMVAIRQCQTAGIKTVMITGDQALTAHAIAERLQIVDGREEVKTGADLQKISQDDFEKKVKSISVYARVSPEQKLNIVKALQNNGEFVAMTGDGVNDAPSLKQADIGVAMGITGTDVSKEAADMILLDDNFATIVKAVREGRRIYENIKKFVLYVLSCNLGEILTIFCAPLLGFPIPLLPIHILWINLVTDGLPGIALVAEHAEKNIMDRPPRPTKENIFAGGMIPRILITAVLMAAASIFIQWYTIHEGYDLRTQQTSVFTMLCFIQLANALSVRSFYHSVFSRFILGNRGMWISIALTVILQLVIVYVSVFKNIFKTSALPVEIISIILGLIFVFVICIEAVKVIRRKA
ncbi:MAG: cation-translocating P-type ATPase [Flavisolibacter sp.]